MVEEIIDIFNNRFVIRKVPMGNGIWKMVEMERVDEWDELV